MRNAIAVSLLIFLSASLVSLGKDKSGDYQIGIYAGMKSVQDGTFTDTTNCIPGVNGTACSGGAWFNQVGIYRVRVQGGTWFLETYRQASDTTARKYTGEPVHIKEEKPNPLDFLKNGDKVMFRVERHRKINGTETDVFIPYANDPRKEAKFVGSFAATDQHHGPAMPTDNVKAMCESGKLSPELQAQYCK
jgi:hypothetical protein